MKQYFLGMRLFHIWQEEFDGYNVRHLQKDLFAGVAVAAVALPLALAYGVAYGTTAAAGLVTAIVAGFVIALLGGMRFQISGPTGALSAVIIVLAGRYGLEDIWIASIMAGIIIILMGIFKLGQIINFIPSAVITGFMSGIAAIVLIGQIDNLLGVTTVNDGTTVGRLLSYAQIDHVNLPAVVIGLAVIAMMIFWPKRWQTVVPGSLAALVAATVATSMFNLDVQTIGHIPQSIMLEHRFTLSQFTLERVITLAGPALSIAVLASIKSLLCGAVASREKGAPMDSVQELFGLGVGNIVLPFFGGIPASGALARSSLAMKSGAVTRLAALAQSFALLVAVWALAPFISQVPLAALGGVLAVTAWHMNDWRSIRDIFRQRFTDEIVIFITTFVGTVVFDLTQAVVMGLGVSALIFVLKSSGTEVVYTPISVEKMREAGYEMRSDASKILVVYVVGPLFFGTVHTFNSVVERLNRNEDIILSLRTVPLLDTTGLTAIEDLIDNLESEGRRVYLSGLTRPVREKLERTGVIDRLGADRVFWSADQAIVAADRYRAELANSVGVGA